MKKNKQAPIDLANGGINGLMLRFSIPCVLSLLISSLYNVVDQMFIGNSELSTLGNAATGVVFPVFIIAQAFAWSLGDGCAAYLNIFQGRRDDSGVPKAIGGSISICLLVAFLMMAVIYPIKVPMLMLFGATENTIAYAVEYLDIILLMMPMYVLCNTLNSVIRADGSPMWAMISMLAGAVVNIILDPVFIFGLKMGMTGAALATFIGQGVAFLATAWYFLHPKTFKLSMRDFLPDFRHVKSVIGLGCSTFITQIAIVIVAVLTVMMFVYLKYSKQGYEISVVGESEKTAKYIGINVKKVIIRTLIASGALCGIAGLILVGGTNHTISTTTAGGRGFTAIMVSWLAKFNPIYMILTSFLIVFLEKGAGQVSTDFRLPLAISDIVTGIILFFIIGSEFFLNYKILVSKNGKEND